MGAQSVEQQTAACALYLRAPANAYRAWLIQWLAEKPQDPVAYVLPELAIVRSPLSMWLANQLRVNESQVLLDLDEYQQPQAVIQAGNGTWLEVTLPAWTRPLVAFYTDRRYTGTKSLCHARDALVTFLQLVPDPVPVAAGGEGVGNNAAYSQAQASS